jgi:hypothetical protein
MGHSVTVVTGTPNYPEGVIYPGYEKGTKADEVMGGVTVHRCPLIPRKSGALYRFLNYYSFVFSSEKYLRSLKEDFDVVFVNQLSPVMMAQAALSWAKRKGKRCVLYCLDLWPESLLAGGVRKDSLIYKVFYRVSRRIYQRADHILVTSRGFVPYFEETLGLTGKKLGYLPQYAEDMFGTLPAVTETKNTVDFLFAGNVGSLQSVETIVEAAPKALENPMDYHARADLMWAGMLAHNDSCGVGRKQDWASHQIEHELSAFYDCAHGAGLAVVMPAWMSYVMPESPARFARFAVEVFGCELDAMNVERTAKEGIRRLKSFFRLLGMPTTLKELGAKTEDIPAMVLHRAEKGFPFGGMVEIGPAEMADILLLCDEE